MENRQQKLLKSIIDIYTKTAQPVGSKILAQGKDFEVSPATIRNDMASLEHEGYITHPHTSAGRIPTLAGYEFYIDNLLKVQSVANTEVEELSSAYNEDIRQLAKLLVDKTNLATIVGLAPNDYYFTGLFNLFSQPEFEDYKMVLSMSQVVDSLEKAIADIYHDIDSPRVLLGQHNPISDHCSLVATPLKHQDRLLAVLGPVRMDYGRVLGLFEAINNIVK